MLRAERARLPERTSMNHKTLLAAVLLGATALAGPVACKMAGTDAAAVAPGTEAGIKLASMDKTVKPGDDFNAYANGTWQKITEIPADRSNTGAHFVAFEQTERQQNELLSGILEGSPEAGSNEAKIKAKRFIAFVGFLLRRASWYLPPSEKYRLW